MRRLLLSLLLGIVLLAALPLQSARAYPSVQSGKCGFTAFVHPGLRDIIRQLGLSFMVIDERTIQLQTVSLRILICASQKEDAAAQNAISLIEKSLPILERHAGLRPGLQATREVVILPTQEMYDHYADGMHDPVDDTIYLHARSPDWAIIHEAAHYFANHNTLNRAWLREGYAEYLTSRAVKELGMPLESAFSGTCRNVFLEEWLSRPGSGDTCGYSAGAEVFRQIETQVGADILHDTMLQLSELGDEIGSWQLWMALETRSNQDLQAAFRPVFDPQDGRVQQWLGLSAELRQLEVLAQRLHVSLPEPITNQRHQLRMGLLSSPAELERLIPQVRTALQALQQADAVQTLCTQLQLACVVSWSQLPDDPKDVFALASRLTERRAMLNRYVSLTTLAHEHSLQIPQNLTDTIATLDNAQGMAMLDTMLPLAQHGLEQEQHCAAIMVDCAPIWRIPWQSGDLQAAQEAIRSLDTVFVQAQQTELSCGRSAKGCTTIWQAAMRQGGVQAATQALNAVNYLLDQEQALSMRCKPVAEDCALIWHKHLLQGQLRDAQQAFVGVNTVLNLGERLRSLCGDLATSCTAVWSVPLRTGDLETALERGQRLEQAWLLGLQLDQRCAADGWPCDHAWRSGIAADLDQGEQLILQIDALLIDFQAVNSQLVEPDGLTRAMAWAMRRDIRDLHAQARQALQRAELDQARTLVEEALQPIQIARFIQFPYFIGLISTALILGVSMRWHWSTWLAKRRYTLDQALLKDLLQEQPHDDSRD